MYGWENTMMLEDVKKFLSKDKYMDPLMKKFGPIEIKPRGKADYFEHLLSSITNQQLSGKAADTIFGRVKERVGVITPKNILAVKDGDLRACGLSWAKVSYVKDLSKRVKNFKLKVKNLDQLPDDEVMKELIEVKGIGRWTAEMFLMFTLARPDIFPADDLGIKNGLKKLTGREMKPKEIAEFAQRWKPYRTYAARYVWESLDNK